VTSDDDEDNEDEYEGKDDNENEEDKDNMTPHKGKGKVQLDINSLTSNRPRRQQQTNEAGDHVDASDEHDPTDIPVEYYRWFGTDKASHLYVYCHGLPRKWTDLAVMTTQSAYISHGQGPEYRCSRDSHAVKRDSHAVKRLIVL
jgi:hypothetical protein